MIILNAGESRELDRLSQATYGIPSYALMRRAGEAVAIATLDAYAEEAAAGGLLLVAGKGNNGGDGFVTARKLIQSGSKVRVVLIAPASTLTGDAARAYAELIDLTGANSGTVIEAASEDEVAPAIGSPAAGVVVDAIFGTGLNAEVKGAPRRAIEAINALGLPIVAVDIASGVSADT